MQWFLPPMLDWNWMFGENNPLLLSLSPGCLAVRVSVSFSWQQQIGRGTLTLPLSLRIKSRLPPSLVHSMYERAGSSFCYPWLFGLALRHCDSQPTCIKLKAPIMGPHYCVKTQNPAGVKWAIPFEVNPQHRFLPASCIRGRASLSPPWVMTCQVQTS